MAPFVLLLVLCISFASSQNYNVPDNINVDEILKNDRLMKNYVDCLLGKGKCTPEGEQLKKTIPDALQNECSKCSEKQKEATRKVIHHLIEKKSDWWKELEAKYDSEGLYQKKYDHYLKEEGLKQ